MKHYDVAIIGASISGGTLAGQLGRKGLSVALIDQGNFPRRKACGEGLSNVAIGAIERMGLPTHGIIDIGIPYYGYRMIMGRHSFALASGKKPSMRGVGVQRFHLDRLILESARVCPSVETILETFPSEIRRETRGHSLRLSNGSSITARQLVLADGANSKTAARLGIPVHRKSKPLWGISFIMEGNYQKPPHEVVVLLKKGFEVNCTPVSQDRLNVTFLAEKSCVQLLQDRNFLQDQLRDAMLRSGFHGIPEGKPLSVGPVCAARRPHVHKGILLVGDAAENLDPIAGMGMTHGILMSEIAAGSIVSHLINGLSADSAHEDYAKRAGAMSRNYRGFTRMTASLLRSPARRILVPIASASLFPRLVREALDDLSTPSSGTTRLPRWALRMAGTC